MVPPLKNKITKTPDPPSFLLTIDVEDWFQVENFKSCISYSSWPYLELRVERNTHRILDLLDDYVPTRDPESAAHNPIKGTFFILGWLADRLPGLVREIHSRGHEVASHGNTHVLCRQCDLKDLKEELINSKKKLEDITGAPVKGFRAPGFSIDHKILGLVAESGYLYDSSYNSFGLNSRYGEITLSGNPYRGLAQRVSDGFHELPISNLEVFGKMLPWGGGGYFRLIPTFLFKKGVQHILKGNRAYLFYFHPWEIDPSQPRVNGAPASYKFRHYVNLNKTVSKLQSLFKAFSTCRFTTCSDFLRSP